MADCDVCGSPLSSGSGGGAAPAWQAHLADFSDPHRTLELVRGLIPRVSVGSAPPGSVDGARAWDWFSDLSAGTLWMCLPSPVADVLEWRKVADTSVRQDLSGYATVASLSGYATVASLSAYLPRSELSGYNFVDQASLASELSGYATVGYVDAAVASGTFLTQAAADARYVLSSDYAQQDCVTSSQLASALSEYLTGALAASTYLTLAAADANDGFVRKGDPLPYATSADIAQALSGYALTTDLSGYITQSAADDRYVRQGTGDSVHVTRSELNAALVPYLAAADAASYLDLSGYLTTSAADASDGFLRKARFAEAASAAGLLTSAELTTRLASYVTQGSLSGVVEEKVAEATEVFATSEDLADLAASLAVESGTGTALAVLELESGKYRPPSRSNCIVVLAGDDDEIPLLMPVRSAGVSRDFILAVAFDRGLDMWTESSFEVVPSTRPSETVQCSFFSATADVFEVDATSLDLDRQMVVFGFTEVADGKFLVSRKIVTDLAPQEV